MTRHALVLDSSPTDLGPVALRLVRLGMSVHHARWEDEALLLCQQERGRIRAVVVAPDIDLDEARRARDEARLHAAEGDVALAVVGQPPPPERREALRAAGASWAVWEPFDDADLRFVLNSAMALPSELAPRAEPRAPVSQICWLVIGGNRSFGVLGSVSARGAFVEMAQPPPVGTRAQLRFALGEIGIETEARVLYRSAPGHGQGPSLPAGCGVLFDGIASRDQERIREHVGQRAARFTV